MSRVPYRVSVRPAIDWSKFPPQRGRDSLAVLCNFGWYGEFKPTKMLIELFNEYGIELNPADEADEFRYPVGAVIVSDLKFDDPFRSGEMVVDPLHFAIRHIAERVMKKCDDVVVIILRSKSREPRAHPYFTINLDYSPYDSASIFERRNQNETFISTLESYVRLSYCRSQARELIDTKLIGNLFGRSRRERFYCVWDTRFDFMGIDRPLRAQFKALFASVGIELVTFVGQTETLTDALLVIETPDGTEEPPPELIGVARRIHYVWLDDVSRYIEKLDCRVTSTIFGLQEMLIVRGSSGDPEFMRNHKPNRETLSLIVGLKRSVRVGAQERN
jgi:hypothetical protein